MNCAGKFNLLYIAPTTAAVVGTSRSKKLLACSQSEVKDGSVTESEDLRW